MKDKVKVILCGYHTIGERVLNHLLERDDVSNLALFTHEPKDDQVPNLPKLAAKLGVWCSTESISKSELPFEPDIIASVYYRNIIKPHVIKRANGKIFNVHPSLLPKHRGCSSIPWAIIEGDTATGVTFHYIDEGIDTGNIIFQAAFQIDCDDTQETLFNKAMIYGGNFWPYAFELVKIGISGVPQPKNDTCYHKRGAPYNGIIDDEWDDIMINRFIRAMTYPPYPYAKYNGKEIKEWSEFLEEFNKSHK